MLLTEKERILQRQVYEKRRQNGSINLHQEHVLPRRTRTWGRFTHYNKSSRSSSRVSLESPGQKVWRPGPPYTGKSLGGGLGGSLLPLNSKKMISKKKLE